ncbi:phosphatase PAP2 family protein [Phenylobacterium sp. J367]|uniref:acid phosphatase n=1 Tax=Phenylobacterium sp. J367 TaxID=2898435 RepID=UPI0021511655|nr:phosphatase PAP2 family protein [Phenylobacterium sp. J367]MCR5877764.1 phosphatase PAP2 family protein [Phenylobacterium sp. J367]
MIRTLALAAALAAVTACATDVPPPPKPAVDASLAGPVPTKLTGYLPKDALDGRRILPGPVSPDSAQGRAERAYYDETRKLEGSDRWKRAIEDNEIWQGGALNRFSCALGKQLSEAGTPTAWRILHRIELDVRDIGNVPKNHYNRDRPLIGNDKPICIARQDWMKTNASYPSGHAMVGWTWALLLTELAPERADPLLVAGREMGESRAICGVHFMSDIEAGRTLASGMVARLHAEPAFNADMAKARKEIAAAPAAANCPSA